MSTAPDIEETLRHVAETVDVPRPDETAFRRRVRRERSRAMAVRTLAVGAAAAVVVTGASFASLWAGADSAGDAGGEPPVAGPPKGVVAEDRPPVYLSVDGRLSALDPLGELHDLGVAVEQIVGATPDGVLAVGRESHLVRFRAVEGDTGWRFERLDPPVQEAVQGAAVSSASGLVAWRSADDDMVAYDLKTERLVEELRVSGGAAVLDVGTGVLVADGDEVLLTGRDGATALPWELGMPWAASTGGEVVALSGGDGAVVTQLYEVSESNVRRVSELPGAGELSPDGRHYLAIPGEEEGQDGRVLLWSRDGGGPREVAGLSGHATGVAWVDADTAAVTARQLDGGGGTDVYTCEASTASCVLALTGGTASLTLTY